MRLNTVTLLFLLIAASTSGAQPLEISVVRSPDSNIAAHFWWDSDSGQIGYSMSRAGATVLNFSRLGISLETFDLGDAFKRPIVKVGTSSSSEFMKFRFGKRSTETYSYRTMLADCLDSEGHRLRIEFRASNDGIAFRYLLPGTGQVLMKHEYTSYQLPRRSPNRTEGYMRSRRDRLGNYQDDAETRYRNTSVAGIPDEIGYPALFDLRNGDWLLLSESGNDVGYPDGHLLRDRTVNDLYHQWFRDLGNWEIPLELPFTTPWRVAIIGDLKTIFESDLIRELGNSVQKRLDFGFVVPGIAATSAYAANDDYNRAAVKAAASLHLSWVSFDATWNRDPCITRRNICEAPGGQSPIAYAHQHGLKVLLWVSAAEIYPRSTPRAVLSALHAYGADGAKVDFMQGYWGIGVPERPPEMYKRLNKYLDVAQAAAEQRMCILFHGDSVPRGLERRFPNVLGFEAVRNAEHFYDKSQSPTADQNNIITYTRNVVGPMDFMIDPKISARVMQDVPTTTSGHTVAEIIVFSSGLSTLWGGNAEYIADSMPMTADLFRSLPQKWDDIRWLDGRPGASTMLARRAGGTWFLGLITANPAISTVSISFDFLRPGTAYKATLYSDDPTHSTREGIVRSVLGIVSNTTTLSNIEVQARGGLVIRFSPRY